MATYSSSFDISILQNLFEWGSVTILDENIPGEYRGKEISMIKTDEGRIHYKVTQKSFIRNLKEGKLRSGRLKSDDLLEPEEVKEFRSVSGCIQWLGGQCRPELASTSSLCNRGSETRTSDLHKLHEALKYAKESEESGIVFADIPVNRASCIVTYTDSSWANAANYSSQFGVVVTLCPPQVTESICTGHILDWKSGRSPRVCRSTLAAEACAADEGTDRACYINLFLTELLCQKPAWKGEMLLSSVQCTDSKSLYDCLISQNPSVADKRSMVQIRSVQQALRPSQVRWLPTQLMAADSLTKVDQALRETLRKWCLMPKGQGPVEVATEPGMPMDSDTPLAAGVTYDFWESLERLANLFRIYPDPGPYKPGAEGTDSEDGGSNSLLQRSFRSQNRMKGMTPAQARLNMQKEEMAKAYMGLVIRAFSAKETQVHMNRWFGRDAFYNPMARKEVLRVMNSVDHMISNVYYVYPGVMCTNRTFAYVYPKGGACEEKHLEEYACRTIYDTNQFVFYLCPFYFSRPLEMVETLVHEGSHHATAYTQDVEFQGKKAYGRHTCQELAKKEPLQALKNADSFCYYIQDAADGVQDHPAEQVASRCPKFAEVEKPDNDGDCVCPAGTQCHFGGRLGCPFSATARRNVHNANYFNADCMACSCEGAVTTTEDMWSWDGDHFGWDSNPKKEPEGTLQCPENSALPIADSQGDCYCSGGRHCFQGGEKGCVYSGTDTKHRLSPLYFRASCSDLSRTAATNFSNMATAFLGLAAFGAFHWKMSGTDVNFQWLQQLGGLFARATAEEAAQKERIQKNTAILRVSNYILFSHVFVHFAAWKTMWVVVGFVHSPQLTTGALMALHLGLYIQHLLVVKRYIQPTSRQVRVLSAVVYVAYAAGYFLATALQDATSFPNRAVTISEKYLLATRFFLVMAFVDTELSVVCQFFFSLTILGTSWYHGKELGYVQVTEECEIYGCLLAFVLIIDVMMRKRVQACLQSADAEWMVSSFRRVLRGVCDCEFLLDHNLRIQGNPECLQHMLMSDEKLQGVEFTQLLADQQDTFRKFVEISTGTAKNIKSPTDVQAASCIRVSFATASRATRSAHLFHVAVPQPLGEPYHLLAVREDSESPVTEPFEAAFEPQPLNENMMSPSHSERRGMKGAISESSVSTIWQPEGRHGVTRVKEILEMMLLVDADSEQLNVEQLQISFRSNCKESPKALPNLQTMVNYKDWSKVQRSLRTFADRAKDGACGSETEVAKPLRLRLPWDGDGSYTMAAHVEMSHFRRPSQSGQKLCLQLKDFFK
eukprot:s3811_g1.t2